MIDGHSHARLEAGQRVADWAFADNAVKSEPVERLRSWVTADHRPLIVTISGANGRGKTVAAARWIGRMGGMFLRSDAFGREDWTGGRIAKRAAVARHLVIDDLGAERGRAREHVNTLIAERYDAGRVTLITTAMIFGASTEHAGSILAEYPGSVHSRMTAGFTAVTGPDLRSDDVPDLSGVARAELLSRAAETCRRLDALGDADRAPAVQRLADLLGTTIDAPDVRRRIAEIEQQDTVGLQEATDFAAEMVRKAAAVADARGRR